MPRLIIRYDSEPIKELDKELKNLLSDKGFIWYAQGYDYINKTRDIAFDFPPRQPQSKINILSCLFSN
jgi:hypothetical protein